MPDLGARQKKGVIAMQTPSHIQPIALSHDDGEALGFLGVLATVTASSQTTAVALLSSSTWRQKAQVRRYISTRARTNG